VDIANQNELILCTSMKYFFLLILSKALSTMDVLKHIILRLWWNYTCMWSLKKNIKENICEKTSHTKKCEKRVLDYWYIYRFYNIGKIFRSKVTNKVVNLYRL
jgi:hypothetical protein